MAKDRLNSPESVIRNAWDFIKPLLLNQRGEVGEEGGDPGEESGDWDVEGKLAADKDPDVEPKAIPTAKPEAKPSEEPEETPKSSEETLKPKEGEPEPEEEEEEEEVEEKEPSSPKYKEMETRLQALEADNANLQTQSQFYQTQLNEALGQAEEEGVQEPGKVPGRQETTLPSTTTDKLPEGIRGPQNVDADGTALRDGSGWDTQKQMAQYIDNRVNTLSEKAVTEHPYFKRTNEVLMALSDIVARIDRPDFDEVVQHAYDEVFNIDPNTKQIISTKNESLLRFFRVQPIPALAAYEHGLKKVASQKISEGKRTAVKETLEQIEKKPKKVTQPKGAKATEGKAELEWETPSDQVEIVLDKVGLI